MYTYLEEGAGRGDCLSGREELLMRLAGGGLDSFCYWRHDMNPRGGSAPEDWNGEE